MNTEGDRDEDYVLRTIMSLLCRLSNRRSDFPEGVGETTNNIIKSITTLLRYECHYCIRFLLFGHMSDFSNC